MSSPYVQQPDPNDVSQNKVMAILAYILFFVPLLAAKNSPFAMYHANQGLTLFISAVAANIVAAILGFIPLIGWLLQTLVPLAILVMVVLGIMAAASGQNKPLPFIGAYTLLK